MEGQYFLSEAQIQQFRQKGFIKLDQIASKQQLENFRQIMNQTVQKKYQQGDKQNRIDDYSNFFTQVTNLWKVQPKSQSFVLNKKFANIAKTLLGVEKVRLYHDQALVKNPKAGKTPWHQDYFYWPIDSSNTVTMWIPMHDCTRQMGTMKFVAGSHLDESIKKMPISEQSQKYFQEQINQKNFSIQTFDLLKGDATFHYGRTLHCAHSNGSSQKRQVMTVIYMEDGVKSVSEQNMNQFRKVDLSVFCPNIKNGELIDSQLNPIIA